MASTPCPQCGTLNPAGARFCRGCGLNLTQSLRQTSGLNTPTSNPIPTPTPSGQAPAPPPPPPPPPAVGGIGATPLAPGVTLQAGRYVVDRALGSGGMGSVFLARDTHVNNKPVVIKEMANVYSTEAERREAEAGFQAEMATLANLSHPNIPGISDYFTESNRHFAVQDYVAGQDLQKTVEAVQTPNSPPRGLPEKSVLSWTSQVLSVLDYLEAQNPQVIHRDIKPANIVVDPNNRVRVVDFGIASHKFKPGSTRGVGAQLSTALGTPGYAPKEQFSGQETPLSDLYALGATMHHLLTGRDPTKIQPLWQYPPVRAISPKVSEATERIVARALQNDEKKRYQSAAAMKKDVDRVLNPPGALSTLRGRAIALLVVLLLLAGAAGGSLFYTQYQQQQQARLRDNQYVSSGGNAFDLSTTGRDQTASDPRAWASIKQKATADWKAGNLDQANAEYAQATTNDKTDAESWIYQENYSVRNDNPIYIAIGGSFSGADVFSGRELLQGAYTAQKEINHSAGKINGRPISLLLANDNSTNGNAIQSARSIAANNDVLAMVGYRTSPRTALALPVLSGAGLAMVSPTASSATINSGSNASRYFFRVCPDDSSQAAQAVRYMLGNLIPAGRFNARVAVFADPNDQYSSELGAVIGGDVQNLGGQVLTENYTVGDTADFTSQARDLVARKADVIYFAGYAREALLLARALDAVGAPPGLSIMTDQEFYNPSEFVAQPGHKGRFHFTSFFYPDEWSQVIIPPAPDAIKAMESTYAANFHRFSLPFGRYGSDRVPAGAALAYDAVHVVATAIRAAGSNPTRQGARAALATIGVTAPRYQGITGPIAFAANGDPVNKTILILHLDENGRTRMDHFLIDGWLGQYG